MAKKEDSWKALAVLVHQGSQIADDKCAGHFPEGSELTPRQAFLLAVVADNEGVSQTRLVELTKIDRSTLADMVRRLIKNGLLQRRRTQKDARAYAVRLTSEGNAVLGPARTALMKANADLVAKVGKQRAALLLEILEEYVEKSAEESET